MFTEKDRHPEINAIGSLAVIAVLLSFAWAGSLRSAKAGLVAT